ncbi:MAG: MOFRL family protein, partial [Eubacteriales bacterium]|nr:MOFRL family protein [Eubacteriales bacterium]
RKFRLELSAEALRLMGEETPKALDNVETRVTGSVTQLCGAAAKAAQGLGYVPQVLTTSLTCVAREAGSFLGAIAREHQEGPSRAMILGGETVVKVTGRGQGGRNQEIALSAAIGIRGLKDTAVFSVGSDGTDGPTDAAGGYCDGESAGKLIGKGIQAEKYLDDNNAYHALQAIGGLIITGPTGTNVNDLTVLLIRRS